MSVGSLGFGNITDGSVCTVENIIQRLTLRKGNDNYRETILRAAQEVGRPIFFAVGIIIIIYVPLLTLQGVEGKMFKPVAFTVSLAMLSSLFVALVIMPTLCSLIFRKGE